MKKGIFPKLFFLILLLPLIQWIGCGSVKSVYRLSADTAKSVSEKVMPEKKPVLKKKVLVAKFISLTEIREERLSQFTDILADFFKKDKYLLVNTMEEFASQRANINPNQLGIVADSALVNKADDMGMNVLITGIINPIDVRTEKSGIWPLRKVVSKVEISITVNAIDVLDGTVISTNSETREIKSEDEISEGEVVGWVINNEISNEALSSILEKQASAISDALDGEPWRGKIELEDSKTVRIHGGNDIGMTEGLVFELFGKGELIRSLNGKDYYLLGPKVGEIRVSEVMQEYSLAVPLNNERIQDGQVVRVKR